MKRRTFLAGSAALAGTAGLPIAAQAQARARGNVLRVGVTTFPPGGADPRRSVSVFATYTWSPMFEALTTFSEATELAPELAVAWQATSPTTWHFKLREGAKFSTGRTLTAQDVADNLDWLRTPEAAGSPVQRQLESVTAARAIDPLTVEVTTAYPNAILPREISCLYIVEPGLWRTLGPDGFARAPVGTGPFKLTDWGAAKIVYAPNPHSWRPPQLAGLEILDLPEMTSRLQALVTGQIDVAIGMGPDEQPTIEQAGGRLHERSPHDVISLAFVIGTGSRRAVNPLNDVRVRRALNHAVDKDTIASVILQGRSRAATQGAVRGLIGYDPELKPYAFDPDKARALLKEAGWEKGFALDAEVIISSNANDGLIYQFVADNLAKVGVTLNLIPIPTPQMMRVINQGEWKGDAFSQVFGSWPTFDPIRTIRLHSCLWPNPWYCDERITPVIRAAMAEFDLAKRAELTRQILRFYHDEASALLLHEIPLLDGVAPRVRNYAPQKGKINYDTIAVTA